MSIFSDITARMTTVNSVASEDEKSLYILTKLWKEVSLSVMVDEIIEDDSNPTREEKIVKIDWTYDNCLKLAQIGTPVISPIMKKSDYTWPGQLRPFSHQYCISAFLSINKRCFCLSDMGTGKTLATLHAINYLIEQGKIKKILIVCPLSVMRDAWKATIESMDCSLTCDMLYHANKSKRIQIVEQSKAPIHIINPDGVEVIQKQLLANKYDLVVIDELTTYKTQKTSRWTHLNEITSNADYVWGITGTPVPNCVLEAYGQIKIVRPENLRGISYSDFKEIIQYRINKRFLTSSSFNKDDFRNAETYLELANEYFFPAIRIKKEDCLDLPPLNITYLHCPLSTEQIRVINQFREQGRAKLATGMITPVHGAANINKIIQICCGAIYDNDKNAIYFKNKNRIKEAINLIETAKAERTEKNKGKTLLFVPYKSIQDILVNELSKKFKVAKINAEVKEKERAEIFYKLQNTDDLDVIVAIPTTMSHGTTATSASLIIWYAPIHSCETYIQACNRINRAGQTQNMTIAHLYGSEIESKIYKSLEKKQTNLHILLNLYKEFINGE